LFQVNPKVFEDEVVAVKEQLENLRKLEKDLISLDARLGTRPSKINLSARATKPPASTHSVSAKTNGVITVTDSDAKRPSYATYANTVPKPNPTNVTSSSTLSRSYFPVLQPNTTTVQPKATNTVLTPTAVQPAPTNTVLIPSVPNSPVLAPTAVQPNPTNNTKLDISQPTGPQPSTTVTTASDPTDNLFEDDDNM